MYNFYFLMGGLIGQLSVLVGSTAYSWFEPITIRLTQDPDLDYTSEDISWLIAILSVGAFIGSIGSGELTNRYGRKWVIMGVAPLTLLAWIVVACSKSTISLVVTRVLHGFAIGIAFTIPPIYTAEIAEPDLRGRLTGIFQITWYLGTLYAFSTGPFLSYNCFAYVCMPLPVIFSFMWAFMPETPYYLLMSEQEDKAREVLKSFRDGDVEDELLDMKMAVREEMSAKGSWKTLFSDKVERKAFIIVQIVCIAKYLGGVTVITNYALDTFSRSDSFLPAEEMSILLALLLVLIAIISAFMSDWIGRKPLLLVSCFGSFFSHFLTGGYYFMHDRTTFESSNYTWALYIGLSMYCLFSDIGVGALLQTLQSEMFSANTRGVAAGFTEGLASVMCFITLKLYSTVNNTWGIYINFWFYSLVNLVCGIILCGLLYETAGKTIGKMEDKPKNKVKILE